MADESDITSPIPAGGHRDRSFGLMIFGFVELLIAGACLLMAATALMRHREGGSHGLSAVFGAAGLFFGAVGVGSILARRWARAVMLVGASIWAVLGTAGFALLLRGGPRVIPLVQAKLGHPVDPGAASAAWVICVVAGFSLLVLLPVLFLLFYRSTHVKATVEHRDTKTRWTDKVPLPVLGMSGLFSVGSISWLAALANRWVTGVPSIVLSVLAAVVLLLIAWGIYRLKRSAWWMALAFGVVGPALGWLGLNSVDWLDAWSKMGLGGIDGEAQQFSAWAPGTATTFGGIFSVLYLAHLAWIRRHFRPTGTTEERVGTTAQARPGTDVVARD